METSVEPPLLELTAQEFIEILEGKMRIKYKRFYRKWGGYEEAVVLEGVLIMEDIVIPDSFQSALLPIVIAGESQFQKFKIEGGVFLRNFLITSGTFSGNFWISGKSLFKTFWISGGSFISEFWIEGESQFKSFGIVGGNFLSDFRILSGTFFGYFGISDESSFKNFMISGGIFCGYFKISGGKFSNYFEISNEATFKDNFRIAGGEFNNEFAILGGVFSGYFGISDGSKFGNFKVSGGKFLGDFGILDGEFSGNFDVSGGRFYRAFWIEGGSFGKLLFNSHDAIFIETFRISIHPNALPILQLTKGEKDCDINTLQFQNITLRAEEVIQVNGVHFNQIEFTNVLNYGNITLTAVKTAPSYQIDENGKPEVKADSPKRKLNIYNSDIGKTTLIGCDFSEAEFCLESSKITEMFVTGTKLPEKLNHKNPEQLRVGYGQLKKVYENRGDVTTANEYFARQMNAYMETLTWSKHRWELINLWLNRVSTNHGQSWLRGLLATLIISALFFGGYVLTLGILSDAESLLIAMVGALAALLLAMVLPKIPWKNSTAVLSGFLLTILYFWIILPSFNQLIHDVWSYFPEFINPLHEGGFIAQELSQAKESDGSRIVEGLSRIFIAYFIYQLIQAFRKHGKKGD